MNPPAMSNGPNSVEHPADDSASGNLTEGDMATGCGDSTSSEALPLMSKKHVELGEVSDCGTVSYKVGKLGRMSCHGWDSLPRCWSSSRRSYWSIVKNHDMHSGKNDRSPGTDGDTHEMITPRGTGWYGYVGYGKSHLAG